MGHDQKAGCGVGRGWDEDGNFWIIGGGAGFRRVVGDESHAITSRIGERNHDHLFERPSIRTEERFNDVFRCFIDFAHEGNPMEDPIAKSDQAFEEKAARDKAQNKGECEKEDENADLGDDLDEFGREVVVED